jgi:hypothetical protein
MARPRRSGERTPIPSARTAERGPPGNPIPRLGKLPRTPLMRSSRGSLIHPIAPVRRAYPIRPIIRVAVLSVSYVRRATHL